MARALAVVAVGIGLCLASPAPLGATGLQGKEPPGECLAGTGSRPERCVGPVVDESGGGGETVTIVLSVLVGLAVAGVAFVLTRRQLQSPRARS